MTRGVRGARAARLGVALTMLTMLTILTSLSMPAASGDGEGLPPELLGPAPFHVRAVRDVARVAERLAQDGLTPRDVAEATATLEEALEMEPRLVAGWVNLSAASIRACDPQRALFCALVATILEPGERAAARNLRLARRLECPDPPPARSAAPLERAILESPSDPATWIAAAAERRSAGKRLVASFFEGVALDRGAERASAMSRIAGDLEAEGMLRQALSLLERSDDSAASAVRRRLEERVAVLAPEVEALAAAIVERFGLEAPEASAGARALGEMLLARGLDRAEAERQLTSWLGGAGTRRHGGSFGVVSADAAWTVVQGTTGASSWPELVLRRFPGDTQVSLHAWPATAEAPDAVLRSRLAEQGAAALGEWTGCAAVPTGGWCRGRAFELDLGPEGRGELSVYLVGLESGAPRAAILALVGDAGCGATCRAAARGEVEALVAGWSPEGAVHAEAASWHVPVPRAWQGGGRHDESRLPWRTFPIDEGLRLDVPPGLVVGVVQGAFRPTGAPAGTRIWLRGEFVDRDGVEVTIGDAGHAGIVRVLEPAAEDGKTAPPAADPGARFVARADLGEALRRAGVAESGSVARYEGDAFSGTWLVFETLPASGELGRRARLELPVARGHESVSLLWMPLTIRRGDTAGPPPPVDTSGRFDVNFQPILAERGRVDPRGGMLQAADLQFVVPRAFRVSLNSASPDGFPLTLRADDGSEIAVERWPATDASPERRLAQAEAYESSAPGKGWSKGRRARGGESRYAVFEGKEGTPERCVTVLLPADPASRAAYRIRASRGGSVEDALWRVRCGLVRDSAAYTTRKPG